MVEDHAVTALSAARFGGAQRARIDLTTAPYVGADRKRTGREDFVPEAHKVSAVPV